jgi:hypothetical protein
MEAWGGGEEGRAFVEIDDLSSQCWVWGHGCAGGKGEDGDEGESSDGDNDFRLKDSKCGGCEILRWRHGIE